MKKTITLTDFYKKYNKEYKKSSLECSSKEYKDIVSIILSQIMDKLFKGKSVELPSSLGDLVIGKKRQKKRPIDWKNSKLLGRRVYIDNIHSNGYIYEFTWVKAHRKFKNRRLYSFKPVRNNAREVSRLSQLGKLTIFYRI